MHKDEILRRSIGGPDGQEYFLFVPRQLEDQPRVLVLVHGISRNVREHVEVFQAAANHHGVVLVAPHFDENGFPGYQRLGPSGREGQGQRSDIWLRRILDEVALETGVATERFYVFGHSGGGQFAHRYAMIHPEAVKGYVISAAGWYTMPDYDKAFPRGMKPSPRRPEIVPDLDAFLRIPATVMVGCDDTLRDDSFNQSPALDTVQGRTRIERAETWVSAMTVAARWRGLQTRFDLQIVQGVGHDFTHIGENIQIGNHVCSCLFA